MDTYADKMQENKSQAATSSFSKQQNNSPAVFHFEDNRPEAIAQKKMQARIDNSPRMQQTKVYQEMANNRVRVKHPVGDKAIQLKTYENYGTQVIQREPIIKNSAGENIDLATIDTIENLRLLYQEAKKMQTREIIENEINRREAAAAPPAIEEDQAPPPPAPELVEEHAPLPPAPAIAEEPASPPPPEIVEVDPDKVVFNGEEFVQDGTALGAAEIEFTRDGLQIDFIEVYKDYQRQRLSYLFLSTLAGIAVKKGKEKIIANLDVAMSGDKKVDIYVKAGMVYETRAEAMVVNSMLSKEAQAAALKIKNKWGVAARVEELALARYFKS